MGLLNLFLGKTNNSIDDFKNRGAIILDVRTPQEYQQGAIKGSKNIPLQTINNKIETLKKQNKPIITCCASGMRSANAASILKNNGIEATNGGSWLNLQNQL